MKKILVLSGSSRSNGECKKLVDQFIKNAQQEEIEVHLVQLNKMQINECLACDYCASHNSNCIQQDDMKQITQQLKNCDTIVFATPVYYGGFSARLKAVVDRFYALGSANMSIQYSYLLAVAGREDNHATDEVLHYYHYLTDFMGWKNCGTICLNGFCI